MGMLADLVKKPEAEVEKLLSGLEAKTGFQSHDVRLLAECVQKQRQKIKQLGLDPDDTTAEELHQALLGRYQNDRARLEAALGINGQTRAAEKAEKTLQLLGSMLDGYEVWALKPAEAKRLLAKMAPVRTKKLLNYRSVVSMLKREDVHKILLITEQIESPTWRKNFATKAAKLGPQAYEPSKITLISLPAGFTKAPVFMSRLAGALGVATGPDINVLYTALSLVDEVSQLAGPAERKLVNINPALRWWSDNWHLVAWNSGEPVSFNIKDVAAAHATGKSFAGRSHDNAAKSLWTEIMSRYQQLPEIETSLAHGAEKLAAVPEFALEYNEA